MIHDLLCSKVSCGEGEDCSEVTAISADDSKMWYRSVRVEIVEEPTLMLVITDYSLGTRYTDLKADGSVDLTESLKNPDEYRIVQDLSKSARDAIQAHFSQDEILAGRCLRVSTGKGRRI